MVELNKKVFERLEKALPGSVVLDDKAGTVTLIGWRLEKFEDAGTNEDKANNIKHDPNRSGTSGVSRNLPVGPVEIVEQKLLLVRMVDPLANSPEKNTGRNHSGNACGIGGEKASTVEKEHKGTGNNQHFVPVIKCQLCQRIIHFFHQVFKRRKTQ